MSSPTHSSADELQSGRCQCQKIPYAIRSKSAFRREAAPTSVPPQMDLHLGPQPNRSNIPVIYSYAEGYAGASPLAQALDGLRFLSFPVGGEFSPGPLRAPPWLQEHIWPPSCCSSWTEGRALRAAATLPGPVGAGAAPHRLAQGVLLVHFRLLREEAEGHSCALWPFCPLPTPCHQ